MAAAAWVLALEALLSAEKHTDAVGDLAGDYYCGDGRSFNWSFSLEPDGTYSFESNGHQGNHAESRGRVHLDAGSLTLEPMGPSTAESEESLPLNLAAVRWAGRLYLVPEQEGARFAAWVTRGWEPRGNAHGWFLLRESDWNKPVRGLPEVPERWQKWLLKSPVEANVTRALERHRAEIGAGSNQKVQPGMLLILVSKKYGPTDVRVVSVTAGSSIVENNYGDPALVIGSRVTSRAH
jgi:hypothetical protein